MTMLFYLSLGLLGILGWLVVVAVWKFRLLMAKVRDMDRLIEGVEGTR